jgi:hypothetical protein
MTEKRGFVRDSCPARSSERSPEPSQLIYYFSKADLHLAKHYGGPVMRA